MDPVVTLSSWSGPWRDDDPDAGFKADVAAFSKLDPLPTFEALSANVDVPVGALVRAVLGRWAAEGSTALLELGPSMVRRLQTTVDEAVADGSEEAKLAAFDRLAGLVSWLAAGLDDPAAYP